jgi:hypothetical protein
VLHLLLAKVSDCGLLCRASFELEAGAVGQTTDFKEGSRRLEWNLKKAIAFSVLTYFFISHFEVVC